MDRVPPGRLKCSPGSLWEGMMATAFVLIVYLFVMITIGEIITWVLRRVGNAPKD